MKITRLKLTGWDDRKIDGWQGAGDDDDDYLLLTDRKDNHTVVLSKANVEEIVANDPSLAPKARGRKAVLKEQVDELLDQLAVEATRRDALASDLEKALDRGDVARAKAFDEIVGELEKWRTNNIAFRQRHIDGTDSSPSLASAMMADERRYALDHILTIIAKIR